jgi:hypothetical protein
MSEMILFLTNKNINFFASYFFGYSLDLYMVISPTSGGSAGHEFWVQPIGDAST